MSTRAALGASVLNIAAFRRQTEQPEPRIAPGDTERLTHAVRVELAKRGRTRPGVGDIASALEEVRPRLTRPAEGQALVEQIRELQREFLGFGPLAVPLGLPGVTDVVLNGDGRVWLDRGQGMEDTGVVINPEQARTIAVRLAGACGARLDEACPFADGVLTDLPVGLTAAGIRLHAALSPPAARGTCISLRVLSGGALGLDGLVERKLTTPKMAQVLRAIVSARKNLLISGGTGAGKTTLLAALLAEVPPDQRTVIVEDTPELMPAHPHVVRLATRRGNADGAGEIGMTELVRQCLRMRPDRLVVGEIRGPEIADLLVALNTGHAGSAGTVHANDPAAVPGRLMALGAMAGMPGEALTRQVLDGMDVLIHVARTPKGRRLTHVARFRPTAGGMEVQTVWCGRALPGWEELMAEVGDP